MSLDKKLAASLDSLIPKGKDVPWGLEQLREGLRRLRKDPQEAQRITDMAEALDAAHDAYQLGLVALRDDDLDAAERYFRRAAEADFDDAAYQLALVLDRKSANLSASAPEDADLLLQEATDWYKEAAAAISDVVRPPRDSHPRQPVEDKRADDCESPARGAQAARADASTALFLDHRNRSEPLRNVPAVISHIVVLVIVVEDDSGLYLVLEMLVYGDDDPALDTPDEGVWTLPHVEYRVPWRGVPPTTVGAVQAILDRHRISSAAMKRDAETRAYQLGLADPKVNYLGPVTVHKPSSRLPGIWLTIRFHPFLAWATDDGGRRNIADPEALRAVMHLPLDDLEDTVTPGRERSYEWWFRGKPIAPEVQYLLAPDRRERLLEHPVRLRPEHFYRKEQGLIIVADLAGWGKALQAASDMTSIDIDGAESVQRLLSSTTGAFNRLLNRLGPAYSQETGDGIMAVFPERLFDIDHMLDGLMPCWMELLQHVEGLNRYLHRHSGTAIGSRLVLHHGSYRYGRIAQARSHRPAVQGMTIVEAARIEQGLALLVREQGGTSGSASGWRHTLAISEVALRCYGGAVKRLTDGLKPAGRHPLYAKESVLEAHVWTFNIEDR